MWIGAGVGSSTVNPSTLTLLATLSGGALLLRPFTILRSRIVLYYRSDQIAATETPLGTFANIVVTDTAAALGVTALPNPSGIDGDPEASWFVHQPVNAMIKVSTAVGFVGSDFGIEYTVDSKAMRKVGPDDDIATLFDQQTGVGAEITTSGRRLIQLH